MLAFTRSSNLLLAGKALPLWPALLESAERGKSKASTGSQPPPAPAVQLPADCVEALLELSGAGLFAIFTELRFRDILLRPPHAPSANRQQACNVDNFRTSPTI